MACSGPHTAIDEQSLFQLPVGEFGRQRPGDPSGCDPSQILAHRAVRDAQFSRDRPRRRAGAEAQCHQSMYPPHSQPLGGHPSLHRLRWSSGCQLDADLRDATSSSRSSPSLRWTASSERWTPSDWNAGRDQIRTLDAITSERLDGFHWNLQFALSASRCVGARRGRVHGSKASPHCECQEGRNSRLGRASCRKRRAALRSGSAIARMHSRSACFASMWRTGGLSPAGPQMIALLPRSPMTSSGAARPLRRSFQTCRIDGDFWLGVGIQSQDFQAEIALSQIEACN